MSVKGGSTVACFGSSIVEWFKQNLNHMIQRDERTHWLQDSSVDAYLLGTMNVTHYIIMCTMNMIRA